MCPFAPRELLHETDSTYCIKLRRRIYKGIPDRWRPAVWPLLATLTPDFQPMPASILNCKLFSKCS